MNVLRIDGPRHEWWCPVCDCLHHAILGITARTFNGDTERPTFTPDLCHLPEQADKAPVCVVTITDGQITYLPQCTHALAGQTVPMVPL